jgi:hypothetical protein
VEAAIVNTLSPGVRVLIVETAHFVTPWRRTAAPAAGPGSSVPGGFNTASETARAGAKTIRVPRLYWAY